MIAISHITKTFEQTVALKDFCSTIGEGTIYGLIGSNGSGKSTLLRLLSGIYAPEQGEILLDGAPVYENVAVKNRIFFLSDELYFLPQATISRMATFYASVYTNFDYELYHRLFRIFQLNPNQRISTFSKGMQRQAGLLLAIACRPDYLLLDEAFDGLDPVIRHSVRKILLELIAKYNTTIIISSHNLRELEDLCDQIGLLHHGGLLLEKDLDSAKLGFTKIQAAFQHVPFKEAIEQQLSLLKFDVKGSLVTLTARGTEEEVLHCLQMWHPLFIETIPLTLEEVFIEEMEGVGYDIQDIIL